MLIIIHFYNILEIEYDNFSLDVVHATPMPISSGADWKLFFSCDGQYTIVTMQTSVTFPLCMAVYSVQSRRAVTAYMTSLVSLKGV